MYVARKGGLDRILCIYRYLVIFEKPRVAEYRYTGGHGWMDEVHGW